MELDKIIDSINSWEDWYKTEKEIFKSDIWEEKNIDEMEMSSSRKILTINGFKWYPVTTCYKVDPEIRFLYEKARWLVFDKLEPEAALENSQHPEQYGKQCVYCEIMNNGEYTQNICPVCGHELLIWVHN